jgi:5S rRNA maturation endonuclease (ribonuclease M5)/archaellum biogenesis ATPase FlaH
MNIHDFLSKLGEGVQQHGERWQARCPAHDDGKASLSVKHGNNGGIIVFCHAGCETRAIVSAMNLTIADLMPSDPMPERPSVKPTIVAAYDYRDEKGNLLYQALRLNPKDFRQRRPDGEAWKWNLDGVRRVLYRLPELLKSTGTVYVAEGEKDVDNLYKLGCVATCNVGGAGKWKAEYSDVLKGRDVFILPDNDEPGKKHADDVAKSLKGIANSVDVVELPGLKSKADVSDWIADGGTKDKLERICSKGVRTISLVQAAEKYIEQLKTTETSLISMGLGDVDYAIGGGVELGELVVLAARPSHGKSAIALQCVHNWTYSGMGCAFVSQEMSNLALGKRSLQFISDVPVEHWRTNTKQLTDELDHYKSKRADCLIIESCASVESAAEQIIKAKDERNIQCAVIDYVQLLKGQGKTRYEQVTNASIILRQLASSQEIIVLMLCQLSRGVEQRDKFIPVNSDIKDSGQIEQDADVILHLCWPHKIDCTHPAEEFQFFVGKNRNRAIMAGIVNCRFLPSRQMVTTPKPSDMKNYEARFDNWNEGF